MAEDLDNFFKKKKTKGKKKYTTSDSIKKAVEDSQKVEEQKKSLPNEEDTQNIDPQDDEWIDVKAKETDLSSLKVQSFGTSQSEEPGEAVAEQQSTEDVAEKESNQGNKSGPWNLPATATTQVTVGTPTSNPENNAEIQQPNVSAGVYVPPSLRKQQQASSLRKQQAYKTKKVPDITSQQAFPSLQPSVQNKDSSSPAAAEDQSKETQQHQINMARGIREPIIEHHNRYTALSES